jgi:hypothetical protein
LDTSRKVLEREWRMGTTQWISDGEMKERAEAEVEPKRHASWSESANPAPGWGSRVEG